MANPNDPQTDRGYLAPGGFHVPETLKPSILQHGEQKRLFPVVLNSSVQFESMHWHSGQTAGFNFDFAQQLVQKGSAAWSPEMDFETREQLKKLLGRDPLPESVKTPEPAKKK